MADKKPAPEKKSAPEKKPAGDFKALVAENKKQTKLLNHIAKSSGKAAEAEAEPKENASAQAEDNNKKNKLFESIANGLGNMKKSILGLPGTLLKKGKEGAGKGFAGLKKMLGGALIGGALAALVAFMNSKYWEDTKKFINDTIIPAIINLYDNVVKPLGQFFMDEILPAFQKVYDFFIVTIAPIITKLYDNILVPFGEALKDGFLRSWENIKVFFSDIGKSIELFASGDILGGINAAVNALGGLILGSIDNLATTIYNVFAKIFGLEETDSVGGSIKNFFVGLKDSIVNFFVVTIPAAIESALSFLTQMTDKVFGFFSDIWTKVQGIFGEFSVFQFLEETLGELFGSIKALFAGDFSLENLGSIFGSFMDIVYAPLNLAINTLKDIFGFGNPDEPFRLSEFIMDGIKKIGEFFAGLFDLDIRALASSIMPSAVVDFLFGKKVDTESDEFKSMSDLDQAKATGLYDKDLIGNSEVNANLIGKATTKQLQAILNDADIDEKTAALLRAEIGKRDGAGEFTGTENSGEKEFLLPANARSGIYGYRGTEEYEDILASQNQRLPLRKRVRFADMKYKQIYGSPVSSNDNTKRGQAINDSSTELTTAQAQSNNVVIMNNQGKTQHTNNAPVPLPVATRDSSSSAANSARVYY